MQKIMLVSFIFIFLYLVLSGHDDRKDKGESGSSITPTAGVVTAQRVVKSANRGTAKRTSSASLGGYGGAAPTESKAPPLDLANLNIDTGGGGTLEFMIDEAGVTHCAENASVAHGEISFKIYNNSLNNFSFSILGTSYGYSVGGDESVDVPLTMGVGSYLLNFVDSTKAGSPARCLIKVHDGVDIEE